ncbi:hypothetical protein [Streptomyces mobaraensis]|nr:hypothetical protein [Streptomyces mobaraensis]
MTIAAWLWPVHAALAGLGLLLALRSSGRAVLPALAAVAIVTLAALIRT